MADLWISLNDKTASTHKSPLNNISPRLVQSRIKYKIWTTLTYVKPFTARVNEQSRDNLDPTSLTSKSSKNAKLATKSVSQVTNRQ